MELHNNYEKCLKEERMATKASKEKPEEQKAEVTNTTATKTKTAQEEHQAEVAIVTATKTNMTQTATLMEARMANQTTTQMETKTKAAMPAKVIKVTRAKVKVKTIRNSNPNNKKQPRLGSKS